MVQSMSGKGNCVDNEAAEQAFGCMKASSFAGGSAPASKTSRGTSTSTWVHQNTRRRQVKPKGLTLEELRNQP